MDSTSIKNNNQSCTAALWKKYKEGYIPVIPDIKIKSPGEGELLRSRDPVEYAKLLAAAGAPVISVVTEAEHYGGSAELLQKIIKAVSVPVLRKDFIKSRELLVESALLGAVSVLLIASIMTEAELNYLYNEAVKLGLEPLVEVHDAKELSYAKKLSLTFLGINNRNILTWETDQGTVKTTETIAGLTGLTCKTPEDSCFILSESSISTPEEVRRAADSGAHGVLIGTAILKSPDPVEIYNKLSIKSIKSKR